MEGKKIAFGFTKTIARPNFQPNKNSLLKKKVELITCLEGKEIKLANEKTDEEQKPLVIPLPDSSKTSRALESLKMRKAVIEGLDVTQDSITNEKNTAIDILANSQMDTLEKRAIAELLNEARQGENLESEAVNSNLTLVVNPDELPLDGAKEPTLDDYENIPITQYGMAMLRGMGFKEEINKIKKIDEDILCPRPKGMGLGADKTIKRQPVLIPPEENEKLELKKHSFVKILAGKNKSQYGQIEGFDDRTGRLIVKLALGSIKETFGEYLLQSVSKKEYQTYGKVINSEKYEEYKKKQEANEVKFCKNENEQIVNGKKIKSEKDDKNYGKHCEQIHKDYKEENFKVKLEKNETSKSSRRNSSDDNYTPNYSDRDASLSKHRNERNDNYRNSNNKRYEQLSNDKSSYPRRRSRSRETRQNRDESDSDTSDNSTERHKHKSSKKKSKSSKSKKSKYKYDSSSEDEKKHKKKTKRSKKSRSRSRSRHRR